ncbi:hypothetical protein GobsT_51260 [Gemmata obscuriglobus]|uniref:hypothetical protein n=1 Tax=Gemmata obscuriglobus TaxID=114 RepID=UPI00016C4AF1|nr:hypothetical protein [Gemmata obscuriglobus]QEG30321.1 hypothetical protein GobsT_51260 [Gemmata obscuriglobus]VTS09645.1 unnamed protein product [Gemmata obscuriglobus UQM 2246]
MEFISVAFGRLFILACLAMAFAMMVMKKYAEQHPTDAKRLQVKAGRTLGGWLKKHLK